MNQIELSPSESALPPPASTQSPPARGDLLQVEHSELRLVPVHFLKEQRRRRSKVKSKTRDII